jgi:hypothetical protein
MEQSEFIFLSKRMNAASSRMDEVGNVSVTLRPGILLSHNYKKKNFMMITFTDEQDRFVIGTKDQLQHIYEIHINKKRAIEEIRRYCQKNLEPILPPK